MDFGHRRLRLGRLVIGLVLGLVGGGLGGDVGQQRLHRQLVVIIGQAPFEGRALVQLVGRGLFGDELHIDEIVEHILLARGPFELLRQARADILQRVVDVVLGDRNAVDLGEHLGVGVGGAGEHKRAAEA